MAKSGLTGKGRPRHSQKKGTEGTRISDRLEKEALQDNLQRSYCFYLFVFTYLFLPICFYLFVSTYLFPPICFYLFVSICFVSSVPFRGYLACGCFFHFIFSRSLD
jgi:hypothetical protein